jgi:hypothetical protein
MFARGSCTSKTWVRDARQNASPASDRTETRLVAARRAGGIFEAGIQLVSIDDELVAPPGTSGSAWRRDPRLTGVRRLLRASVAPDEVDQAVALARSTVRTG